MKKLIVGNWKMNGVLDDARALTADIVNGLDVHDELFEVCDFVICPPFLHISSVRHALVSFPQIALGAQDCSAYDNGAYTGDISAEMLKDSSCSYVIVGHSERRQNHCESNAVIKQKIEKALEHQITPILCVGETESEREEGREKEVVAQQIKDSIPSSGTFIVAYEPVWAIGTGKTASPEDAEAMHAFIRSLVPEGTRILYGGSMKPGNAKALLAMPNIDGGLIGGASLKADDFIALAKAAV